MGQRGNLKSKPNSNRQTLLHILSLIHIFTFQREHPQDMPETLEAGTLNSHGIAGLGAAISWITEIGTEQIRKREQQLMWRFYDQVKEIPGVTLYGDFSREERSPVAVSYTHLTTGS